MRKWPNKAAADDSGPALKDGWILPQRTTLLNYFMECISQNSGSGPKA